MEYTKKTQTDIINTTADYVNFIKASRKSQGYIDILNYAQAFFKKEFGANIENITFLSDHNIQEDCSDILHQKMWSYPHSKYVDVCIDEHDDRLINWVESNKNVISRVEDNNVIKSIKFNIRYFYNLIKYDVYDEVIEYNSETYKVKVVDVTSSLFGLDVYVVGYITYRSFGISELVVKPDLLATTDYWLPRSSISIDNN